MSAPGLWQRVQRMLFRRGINTWLEVALWILLVYIVIGVGYAFFHIELMSQLESALTATFTTFADLAALAVTIACWPILWGTALVCGVSGCGVF
jgi:hypothetical protein